MSNNLAAIYAGGRIIADDVRDIAPLSVYKGADEGPVSASTLQDDDALALELDADTIYAFIAFLNYEGNAMGTGDLKWTWSLPTGSTMCYSRNGLQVSGASADGFLSTEASTPTAATRGIGTPTALTMTGTVVTSDTAGTMRLRWAPNTAGGTGTTVHTGSALWATAI